MPWKEVSIGKKTGFMLTATIHLTLILYQGLFPPSSLSDANANTFDLQIKDCDALPSLTAKPEDSKPSPRSTGY